jgi:hypothetical protein
VGSGGGGGGGGSSGGGNVEVMDEVGGSTGIRDWGGGDQRMNANAL